MYKVNFLLLVGFIGFLTVINAVPSTYDKEHPWVSGNLSYPLPENAVVGGFDPYGYYTYIGRIIYASNVLPARVVSETGVAYFNTDVVSYKSVNYQLLVTEPNVDYVWQRSYDGYQEKGAISVGTTSWNERVFICRAKADGGLLVGTLFLSKKVCIIKSEDLPLRQFDKYEILLAKAKSNSTLY